MRRLGISHLTCTVDICLASINACSKHLSHQLRDCHPSIPSTGYGRIPHTGPRPTVSADVATVDSLSSLAPGKLIVSERRLVPRRSLHPTPSEKLSFSSPPSWVRWIIVYRTHRWGVPSTFASTAHIQAYSSPLLEQQRSCLSIIPQILGGNIGQRNCPRSTPFTARIMTSLTVDPSAKSTHSSTMGAVYLARTRERVGDSSSLGVGSTERVDI